MKPLSLIDLASLDSMSQQKLLVSTLKKFFSVISGSLEISAAMIPREVRAVLYSLNRLADKYEVHSNPLVKTAQLRIIVWMLTQAIYSFSHNETATAIVNILNRAMNIKEPVTPEEEEFIPSFREDLLEFAKSIQCDPMGKHFEDLFFPSIQKTPDFDNDTLKFFHQTFYEHGYNLIVELTSNEYQIGLHVDRKPVQLISCLLNLFSDMGPSAPKLADTPPSDSTPSTPKDEFSKQQMFFNASQVDVHTQHLQVATLRHDHLSAVEPTTPSLLMNHNHNSTLFKSMNYLIKHINVLDLSIYERARFFYIANITKSGIPVVYLVMHRYVMVI